MKKKIFSVLLCVLGPLFLATTSLADPTPYEFTFTVQKGAADPLEGVNCYLFNEAGTYLGISGATDSGGVVLFSLADGTYKFRVDYLGYQFWTEVYDVPATLSDEFTIPHQDVVITGQGASHPPEGPGTAKSHLRRDLSWRFARCKDGFISSWENPSF